MIYLTFLSAILLSGIAAYYSVVGLASIFTGAFWPVVIMGTVLEMSKLVTASWLYRNWKTCPFLLKSYLSSAVVILMLITSMGIFGFLAKSHINSTTDLGANSADLASLDQQEKLANDKLNYLLARAKDPSTASNKLDNQIQDVQKELKRISKDKLPLVKQSNTLSVEVGPIKYVAELIYGTSNGSIDKAVRLVIMLIMVVFDPLAVLLLIAANISLKQKEEDEKLSKQNKDDNEQHDDLLSDSEIQQIYEENEIQQTSEKIEIKNEESSIETSNSQDIIVPHSLTIEKPDDSIIKQTTHLAPGVYMEEHIPVDKKKKKRNN